MPMTKVGKGVGLGGPTSNPNYELERALRKAEILDYVLSIGTQYDVSPLAGRHVGGL